MGIIDVIKDAGENELQEVESRIAELTNELDSLRVVEKVLRVKVHGKPERAKPGTKAKSKKEPSELAQRIYDLLDKEGSMPTPAIAASLGVTGAAVGASVHHSDWFEKRNGEVHIATTVCATR